MLCPVCNGLQALQFDCPKCDNAMQDGGKLSDSYGPYSPYVPHDEEDESFSQSRTGHADNACIHAASCPHCGSGALVSVAEPG